MGNSSPTKQDCRDAHREVRQAKRRIEREKRSSLRDLRKWGFAVRKRMQIAEERRPIHAAILLLLHSDRQDGSRRLAPMVIRGVFGFLRLGDRLPPRAFKIHIMEEVGRHSATAEGIPTVDMRQVLADEFAGYVPSPWAFPVRSYF